jgi:hypothetical protein
VWRVSPGKAAEQPCLGCMTEPRCGSGRGFDVTVKIETATGFTQAQRACIMKPRDAERSERFPGTLWSSSPRIQRDANPIGVPSGWVCDACRAEWLWCWCLGLTQ